MAHLLLFGGALTSPESPRNQIQESLAQIANPGRKYMIFLLMFSSFYTVQVLGSLLLVELILLGIVLIKVFNGALGKVTSNLKPYVALLAITVASALVADLINSSPRNESLKGLSLILFTAINLCAVSILTRFDKSCLRIALLGFALSGIAGFFIQPSTYARSEIWKFGIGFPITLALFVVVSFPRIRKFKLVSLFLILLISGVSLYFGARSLALFTFISVFFMVKEGKPDESRKLPILQALLLLAISMSIFSVIYTNLASDGSLGVKAQSKFIAQTSTGGNLIVNSRSELLFAGRAIANSPILGFGSYAKMSPELKIEILNFLSKNQINYDLAPLNRNYGERIPVHSMILQWWLWFGILGICFPISLLFLYFKSVRQSDNDALSYFLAVSGIWNVLFSPYGESYRLLVPLTIVQLIASQPRISPTRERI